MIVRNAIRTVQPRPANPKRFLLASGMDELPSLIDRYLEQERVLALPDFERFVIVMTVLEHYSVGDCALLLGRSFREIQSARTQGLGRLRGLFYVSKSPK
jgi:DNA-directed RNA polymerase specialized sigma24 family protein